MDPRITALADLLDLHTRLYLNCFDGVDDAAALHRPVATDGATEVNHMAFIGAHLLESRYFMVNMLGPKIDHPFPGLEGAQAIDELEELPPASALPPVWKELSELLMERVAGADAELLARDEPFEFGLQDKTLVGALAFLVSHEAYHVGQLALLRRTVGRPAMSYD